MTDTGTITITAGRPNRQGDEKDFAGPDGTYPVTLVAVSDPITEQSSQPKKGPNDDGTWTYRVWTMAIDGGTEYDGQVIDLRANARSTGPKSKQYGLIAAFVGRTPPVGTTIDIQKHLVGRRALAYIATNENDFPFVDKVMALPVSSAPSPAPEPAPEPAPVASPAPLREAVAAGVGSDDLPF